jgi:ABC-2 type transport system ATP-binding protein
MHQLSAGQQTRVNLAKAFINLPRVLLLDEPTASLDPDIAKYIRDFLQDQRKEYNISIIITSHNMAEVEEVCDRVVFINHGEIIANDKPENLAKTIEISHIELRVTNIKKTTSYCEKKKHTYRINGKYITIDVKEKEIPMFLRGLMDNAIEYTEISIEKPTLEDYFIQKAFK